MLRSSRLWIIILTISALVLGASCKGKADREAEGEPAGTPAAAAFPLEEATIAGLQEMMTAGKATSESLVKLYLERIDKIDRSGPGLNSVIQTNPDALAIARELDRERKEKGPRGPLHGIPVLIKDNIDTADNMETTAGSLALLGSKPAKDAHVVERLREAGAVILGKTNLSEWANFRSSRSTSGWSGRGGQTKNPYALDRNPSGSSSGTGAAIAASLAAVGIGTETDGSIVSPSSCCGLVGLKPTVGLVSRSGIVPIAHSQDTAGPMARTVADAATLLGAMAGPDANDPATQTGGVRLFQDYREFLKPGGLKGARIGVLRDRSIQLPEVARPHPPERHRSHEEGRGGDRRPGRIPDARQDGRRRVRGPSLRVQGRPRDLLGREARGGRAHARRPRRLQLEERRQGDAVLRPGDSWSGRPRRAR